MSNKKIFSAICIIISIILFSGIFAFSVSAEETAPSTSSGQATSTEEIILEPTATTTPEIILEQATTTEETATTTAELKPLELSPQPEPEIQPQPIEPQPAVQPTPPPTPTPTPSFDPATAPSKVIIRVLMPDGAPPPFPVFVTFIGVGNKNFGGKINANGELFVIMPSGRYYTDLLVISTEYVQGEDGPSFFLEANEEKDLGVIRLMPKSEMTSQSLADKSLEEDILAQAESAKGIGKILVLIVKLLMKILEEVRNIAGILSNR